jgi:hypothetical protein
METTREAMRFDWKLLLLVVVFTLCIAPTIISYEPYSFRWDDSVYLLRSMTVSKAVWSGDKRGLVAEIRSDIRPPVMTLLGVPWGPLTSWNAAGKCFITLTVLTAFFAAVSLFLLLRIGLNPLYFILASLCAFAALGPYPVGSDTHFFATGFLADSLFAWIAFAAILLIPYETKTSAASTVDGVVRGVLWAAILSAGALTRVNFFYFLGLIIPTLFVTRMRQSGLRSALAASASLAACSFPAAVYWLRYGLPVLKYGWSSSFGHDADFYKVTLSWFLGYEFRLSPGLLLPIIFVVGGTVYLVFKRREVVWSRDVLPLLIMVGYCAIALASSNREIRFVFSSIIALPYLVGLLISPKAHEFSRKSAAIAAIGTFCCLVAAGVPMLHRPDRQSIRKSEEVVAQAIDSNAKRVVLATDSSSLNSDLLTIAIGISSRPSLELDTLGWRAAAGRPIEEDFHVIRESDLVVFQDKTAPERPPRTNQRAPEYEQFVQEHTGGVPITVVDDMRFYRIRDRLQ